MCAKGVVCVGFALKKAKNALMNSIKTGFLRTKKALKSRINAKKANLKISFSALFCFYAAQSGVAERQSPKGGKGYAAQRCGLAGVAEFAIRKTRKAYF